MPSCNPVQPNVDSWARLLVLVVVTAAQHAPLHVNAHSWRWSHASGSVGARTGPAGHYYSRDILIVHARATAMDHAMMHSSLGSWSSVRRAGGAAGRSATGDATARLFTLATKVAWPGNEAGRSRSVVAFQNPALNDPLGCNDRFLIFPFPPLRVEECRKSSTFKVRKTSILLHAVSHELCGGSTDDDESQW